MMIIFSYAPYMFAEGLQLSGMLFNWREKISNLWKGVERLLFVLFLFSGIMAILFCGIVMSHYTHFNLSPVTQITVQHLFRTAAFVSGKFGLFETC